MAEKDKSDLTSELMRRYNIVPEGDQVAPAPAKALSPEAESDPFYSTPPPASQPPEASVNPFIGLEEDAGKKESGEPVQNVLERNRGIAEAGAALGAAAQYKGAGQNFFQPAANLFSSSDSSPASGQRSAAPPAAPMTDVEHTMQSGQGQRPGETGRMRENTHNQETNRQAMAAKQNLQLPGAANIVVNAGPMYTTESGISIPKATASQIEQQLQAKQAAEAEQRRQFLERQAIEQQRIQQQKASRAKAMGAAQGAGRVAQGVVGGALAGPQLYEYGKDIVRGDKSRPADTTQGLSGAGGLMMAFGRGKAGALGALAQLPYMVKNRKELAASMGMSDINPTAFMGMPDELNPAFPQLRPRPVNVMGPGPPVEFKR